MRRTCRISTTSTSTQGRRHGGFAAADGALGIPKSRLSRRVALLEKEHRGPADPSGRPPLRRLPTSAALPRPLQGDAGRARKPPRRHRRHAVRSRAGRCGSPPIARSTCRWATCGEFMAQNPRVDVFAEGRIAAVDVIAEDVDVAIRVRPPPMKDSDLAMRVLDDRVSAWWRARSSPRTARPGARRTWRCAEIPRSADRSGLRLEPLRSRRCAGGRCTTAAPCHRQHAGVSARRSGGGHRAAADDDGGRGARARGGAAAADG